MAPLLANLHRYGIGQGQAGRGPRSFGPSDAVGSGAHKQRRRVSRLALLVAIAAGVLALSAAPALGSYVFEKQMTGFNTPFAVAVDASDNLWVSDTGASTVSEFSPSGVLLHENAGAGMWADRPSNGAALNSLAYGDTAGKIYVADSAEIDIWGLNASDATITNPLIDFFGEPFDTGPHNACCYIHAAVDNSGGANDSDIYVSSSYSSATLHAVSRVDASGAAVNFSATAPYISANQILGTPDHTFSGDHDGIAIDADGNIYVADEGNNEVDEFSPSGAFVRAFTHPDLVGPRVVAIDPTNGHVLVGGGPSSSTIYEFDSSGSFVETFKSEVLIGFGIKALEPNGLAVDSTGTLYISGTSFNGNAIFIFAPGRPLTVSVTGAGFVSANSGTVLGCNEAETGGPDCEGEYPDGSTVTLTANPAAHNHLAGWSAIEGDPGTCTGTTSPCQVAMSEAKKLKAEFVVNTHTVDVDVNGGGSVSANSGAVSGCTEAGGASCTGSYAEDSTLTLTASPAAHHKLAWTITGAKSTTCTGTASPCTVVIGAANVSVSATSAAITQALTVTKAGSGSGSVTCNGGPCAASYEEGMSVTIAATAAAGSTFAGFSGAGCSGTGSCVVTINADTALSATFNANPPVVIPPVVNPPVDNAAYGQCVSKASKAFKKAKKAAASKHGKAKSKALKKATKAKSGAVAKCKAQFK